MCLNTKHVSRISQLKCFIQCRNSSHIKIVSLVIKTRTLKWNIFILHLMQFLNLHSVKIVSNKCAHSSFYYSWSQVWTDCITWCKTTGLIIMFSLVILLLNFSNLQGFLTNSLNFRYPHLKKLYQIKFGDFGGQLTLPFRYMNRPGSICLKSAI